jgi:hypothetical protein
VISQRRLPDFDQGIPVLLTDGQAWSLRLPAISVRPKIQDGQPIDVVIGRHRIPDYEAIAAVLLATPPAPPADYWLARFRAAAALLRSNYDLADHELEQLLAHQVGEPEASARWRLIEDLFLGYQPDPKAESDGSSWGSSSAAPSA